MIYKILKKKLIIKVLILILIFIFFITTKTYFLKIKEKFYKYTSGKKFIDKCLDNFTINNYNISYNSPKFSIVIPLYNCEKTIYYPILSIQKQNMSEYEIILINDFSNDRTYNIINSLKQLDQRIKIINNNKNQGTLYSRCIGTLIAKGEYIFPLDNDDMIFGEDIFYYLYKITQKIQYDIIGFKAVNVKSYSEKITKIEDLFNYVFPDNLIVLQPELKTWLFRNNGKINPHDITIWGKIFKSKIYIDAINILGKKKYSIYMSWAEDFSMNCVIFNIAESFKFSHKYGIMHLTSSSTASFSQPINNNFFGEIFLTNICFDFSKNNEDKNYSVYILLATIKSYFNFKSSISKKNMQYFNNTVSKILKCKYIYLQKKIELINYFFSFSKSIIK